MPISLYLATVPRYVQTLKALLVVIEKAEAECVLKGTDPDKLLECRLSADMLPLAFQLHAVVGHSISAINGILAGQFSPDASPAPDNFADVKHALRNALADLGAVTPEQVNERLDCDLCFGFGDLVWNFTSEGFLLSFSIPNFYFHATTAYDIFRHCGVAIGKMDFLGAMQMKP